MVKFSTCTRCKKPFEQSDTEEKDYRMCPQCREFKREVYNRNKPKFTPQEQEMPYEKNTLWDALGYSENQKKQLEFVSICSYCGSVLNKDGSCPNSRCSKDFG